ncbi:MAG: hypothetical protein OXC69_08225 [Candidatus Tectomicrobia bacterium]|nr:hypothetical protein [Candidatus Tectomicrobia bacterium]
MSTVWCLKGNTHPMQVARLLDSAMEMAEAAGNLFERRREISHDSEGRVLRTIVRQMSVPMRKLCLDDDGALLKGVIADPVFHALRREDKKSQRMHVHWQTPRKEWVLTFENGRKQSVIVPDAQHEIEIGPLCGVELFEEGWCRMSSPFDTSSTALTMDNWLRRKVLQVNSVEYTISDALKLVADFEGAHSTDFHVSFVAVGVNPEDIDKARGMKYRLAQSVLFGCLSYIQLFTMFSGLYILSKLSQLFVHSGGSISGSDARGVMERIDRIPQDFSLKGQAMTNCHELVVIGKSDAGATAGVSQLIVYGGGRNKCGDPSILTRGPNYLRLTQQPRFSQNRWPNVGGKSALMQSDISETDE